VENIKLVSHYMQQRGFVGFIFMRDAIKEEEEEEKGRKIRA
jgi:hypothetical protein